jgi:YfiH family protein
LVIATQVHGTALTWFDSISAARWADRPAQVDPAAGRPAGDVGAAGRPAAPSGAGQWPTCDALASAAGGIGLVVRVADCVPVLLADGAAGLVAAVHAGWRGLLAGVVPAALANLRARGALRLRAALGPSICADCYQVSPDLAKRAAEAGHAATVAADGTARLDLAASVRAQLARAGVEIAAGWAECTAESQRLFSWRQRRQAGRHGGIVMLRPPTP